MKVEIDIILTIVSILVGIGCCTIALYRIVNGLQKSVFHYLLFAWGLFLISTGILGYLQERIISVLNLLQ